MTCRMRAVHISPKRRYPAVWCQNPLDHSLNSPCGGNQEAHSSCCYHRLRHRWDLNSLRWCQLMLFWVSQLIITSASCYQSHASCRSQCFLYIPSKAMNVLICGDCVCCFLEVSYPSLLQPVLYCLSSRLPFFTLSRFHSCGCLHARWRQPDWKEIISLICACWYGAVALWGRDGWVALVWIYSDVGECAKTLVLCRAIYN